MAAVRGRNHVVSNAIGTARRQMDPAPRRAIRVLVVVRHPVGGIRTYLKYTYGALPSGKYRFTVLAVRSLETSHLRRDLEQHALDYVEVPEWVDPKPELFVAQVVGESMNRRIPNGAWCLFRANPSNPRNPVSFQIVDLQPVAETPFRRDPRHVTRAPEPH